MKQEPLKGMTRRALLARSMATWALAISGAGFIAAPDAAWAMEVAVITPEQMATLLQMARDIYPHDKVADQFYAVAVKGYDTEDKKDMVAAGIAELDAAAVAQGHASYLAIGWEADRVKVLQAVEKIGVLPDRAGRARDRALQPERDLADLWLSGRILQPGWLYRPRFQRHQLAVRGGRTHGCEI